MATIHPITDADLALAARRRWLEQAAGHVDQARWALRNEIRRRPDPALTIVEATLAGIAERLDALAEEGA